MPPAIVRSLAWPLLVALIAATLGPSLHATDSHDADCQPALLAHDPGLLRIGAGQDGGERLTQHCAVCHALRLVRLPTPVRVAHAAVTTRSRLAEPGPHEPGSAIVPQVPARAPPSPF